MNVPGHLERADHDFSLLLLYPHNKTTHIPTGIPCSHSFQTTGVNHTHTHTHRDSLTDTGRKVVVGDVVTLKLIS